MAAITKAMDPFVNNHHRGRKAPQPTNQPTDNDMKRIVIRRNANQIILKRGQLRVSFPTVEMAKEALRLYRWGNPNNHTAEQAAGDFRAIRADLVSA